MTTNEALHILGLVASASKEDIKKRYRQLMTQVHPDVHEAFREDYPYTAQEINMAYALLEKEAVSFPKASAPGSGRTSPVSKNKESIWNAPVNPRAYREREILHYMENSSGEILGTFPIAKGKYMWQPEEDFPLFLLSIYKCSKEIIEEAQGTVSGEMPSQARRELQAELAYLLAQQFIDGTALLHTFAKKISVDKKGLPVFYLHSMLELAEKIRKTSHQKISIKEGELLLPSRLFRHKLYLKNQAEQELGYLSFQDDRLYYLVIPLFEQRRVKVKIQVPVRAPSKKNTGKASYLPIHLWIKMLPESPNELPENLNLQIQRLLQSFLSAGF